MAQLGVADQRHELSHLEPLLDALVLDGHVVTADALHTQRAVAWAVISRGGGDLLPVKENQLALRLDIALVFAHTKELADTITSAGTTDCHGDRVVGSPAALLDCPPRLPLMARPRPSTGIAPPGD